MYPANHVNSTHRDEHWLLLAIPPTIKQHRNRDTHVMTICWTGVFFQCRTNCHSDLIDNCSSHFLTVCCCVSSVMCSCWPVVLLVAPHLTSSAHVEIVTSTDSRRAIEIMLWWLAFPSSALMHFPTLPEVFALLFLPTHWCWWSALLCFIQHCLSRKNRLRDSKLKAETVRHSTCARFT